MKGFLEYITESKESEILKMFDPIKKFSDIAGITDDEKRIARGRLLRGAVEPWAGGYINIKTDSRLDVLVRQIPKRLADKYNITETNNIDDDMVDNIFRLFSDYPSKYERYIYSPYRILVSSFDFYKELNRLTQNRNFIVWAMKQKKLDLISHYISKDNYYNLNPEAESLLKKIYFSIKLDDVSDVAYQQLLKHGHPYIFREHSIFHYLSLNLLEIESYNPYNKSYTVVTTELLRIEREWQDRPDPVDIGDLEGISEIYKFKDGTAWFNLNKEFCEIEGNAMRHCGNRAAYKEGDRVLSLRKVSKDGKHHPLLTFIRHADGSLGEAKAKANSKPPQSLHKYIIKLLTLTTPDGDWFIKRLIGGNFLKDNDFRVDDLQNDDRLELMGVRPDLFSK